MKENNALSYEKFIALANEHYEDGGNAIVECWDRNTFNLYISQFGPITIKKAKQIIDEYAQEDQEELAILFKI